MKLVIDANILFAALIKNSSTAKILTETKLKFYAPEFLLEEYAKYKDYILNKTHRTKENFDNFYTFLRNKITIVSKDEIEPFLRKAENISPDPKDTVYLALSLAIDAKFWSNDKQLKENQKTIEILTTEDIINSFKSS